MFLSNYYKFLAGYYGKDQGALSSPTFKNYSGNNVTGSNAGEYSPRLGYVRTLDSSTLNEIVRYGSLWGISNGSTLFFGNGSGTNNYAGVILGDGDTPPALNDYCLSGNIITDFTATTALTILAQNDGVYIAATYNITNTGASTFTIKEIGARKGESYSGTNPILYYRSLLDSPVSIAPGDTGIITLKVKIS